MSESVVLIGMNIRPLVRSAVNAGLDVVAIGVARIRDIPSKARYLSLMHDLGGIFPLGADNFHTRIGQAALSQDANSIAYSGGFENYYEIVAELGRHFELLGNHPDTLRRVRDPFLLKDVVASVGLKTPQILPPGTIPDPELKWLRKGFKSGAGMGIKPWEGVVPDDPDHFVQQLVNGPSQSVSFIANGKKARIFSFSEQLIGDPAFGTSGYRYVGNLLLPSPDPALMEKLSDLATALTRAFHLVGLNGIDFIMHEGFPYILEINPRFSASMELYEDAMGQSDFGWHVAGCRGESLPNLPELPGTEVYGKATVFSRRHGMLIDTTGWVEQGRRDVLDGNIPILPGFPLAMVTAKERNRDECYATLRTKAAELLDNEPKAHGISTVKFVLSQLFRKRKR